LRWLSFRFLGDHWAWRAGYSQATLAWSTHYPPGGRSALNRDQLPREVAVTALTLVAQGAELNTQNLRTWMLDNVVPLLLLGVAVLLLWLGGGKGDNAGVMRRVGGVIIALGVIGLAVSGTGVNLGTWIAGLFSG
jgi:hypothetical protein